MKTKHIPHATFNAFALTPGQAQRTNADIDHCCSVYYSTMASVYNVAQSAMVDALAVIQHRPDIFRHNTKRFIHKALAAYDRLNNALRQVLADRYQLWLDLSDTVDDDIRPHVRILRLSFQQYLTGHGVADSYMLAHLETALTLIKFARATFDTLFSLFDEKVHVNMRPLFRGGDFRDVEFWWERAVGPLLATPKGMPDINFNLSPHIRTAFDIVAHRLSTEHIYNKAAEAALRLNPDTWHCLDREDRIRLKKGIPFPQNT